MEKEKLNRTRIIGLRLRLDEYTKIEKKWKASTCRKLSDYVRHCLLDKPIVTTYRNSSQDDLLTELARLRSEFNNIGNNFNQVVKRLHTLKQTGEYKGWLMDYEGEKNNIDSKIDEVRINIKKLLEIWLR